MVAGNSAEIFLFDRFRLDRRNGLFRCVDGSAPVPVNIGSRALEVLVVLVERRGNLVPKSDILAAVWPTTIVDEANLSVQISTLRKILDEGRSGASCIQTVPGRGYRLIVDVAREAGTNTQSDANHEPLPAARSSYISSKGITAGVAVVVLAVLATLGWKVLHDAGAMSWFGQAAASAQASDERLSTIVLPFENSSGDPAQDDVAARLTRDLTDRIAQGSIPVVPAVTATAYRGKSVDLQTIGHQYNVHFVVVGNVRRQAGHVVSSANAYDVAEGQPIWSRQLDVPDGPGVLAAVVQKIYEGYWQASLDVEVARAMRDHPDRLDKRDLMNASLSTRLSALTKEHYLEKMSLAERALKIDPDDLQALERQARFHAEFVLLGYSPAPASDLAIAEMASDRLFAIDPNNLLALRARATVLRARGDWPVAEAVARRVLAIQPTEANRHYELGFILMAQGRHQEALLSFQDARRFAGGADPIYVYDANAALAQVAIGQQAEAIAIAQVSISELPPTIGRWAELPWLALIAAKSDSGQDDDARADLRKFLAASRSWHSMSLVEKWPGFAANQNLLAGLRKAGMPTEAAQP
jgi:DNA-binding winged helix-turn-helix (wHTH) protein/TolB-like protein/tetratricopeptide (TPR) repeat protein